MKKEKFDYELSLKLRKLTTLNGGDLFGVASPNPLSGAPEGFRPQDLLPGCKSVIVVGKRLSDATVETTPSRMFDTLYSAVNSFIDQLMLRVTDTLIREGYQAVGVGPHSLDGKQLRGDISQKHAAVTAGLGRFHYLRREPSGRIRHLPPGYRLEPVGIGHKRMPGCQGIDLYRPLRFTPVGKQESRCGQGIQERKKGSDLGRRFQGLCQTPCCLDRQAQTTSRIG